VSRKQKFLGGKLDVRNWTFTGHEQFDKIIASDVEAAFSNTFEEDGPFIQLEIDDGELAIKVALTILNERETPEWSEPLASIFDPGMMDDDDVRAVRDKLVEFVARLNKELGE
jgi:hypothetical protein